MDKDNKTKDISEVEANNHLSQHTDYGYSLIDNYYIIRLSSLVIDVVNECLQKVLVHYNCVPGEPLCE